MARYFYNGGEISDLNRTVFNGSTPQALIYNGTVSSSYTITTDLPSGILQNSIVFNGTFTGNPVAYGFEWSTAADFSTVTSITITSNNFGAFSYTATGLTTGDTYYIRAWMQAFPGQAKVYGDTVDQMTMNASVPIVTVPSTVDPAATSIIFQSTLTSDGGAVVTEVGMEWGTTTSLGNSTQGTLNGSTINTTVSGLDAETTYYFRTYAINSIGTGVSITNNVDTDPAAFQPADIYTGITVNASGDTTVTTNNSGFVYYIGSAMTGGQTFTGPNNSATANDVYPEVNMQTGRLPFVGIQVDDPGAPNNGMQLSIRTLQSALQPPALVNLTNTNIVAGPTSANLTGSVNTAGAQATSLTYYWSFDHTTAADLIANGNSVNVISQLVNGYGSVSDTITFASSTTSRTIYSVLVSQNSESSVVSESVIPITVNPPVITFDSLIATGASTLQLQGTMTSNGGADPHTSRAWISTDGNFGTFDNRLGTYTNAYSEEIKIPTTADPSILHTITGLDPNTIYYVRIGVENVGGWSNLPDMSATTQQTTVSGSITYLTANFVHSDGDDAYSGFVGDSIPYSVVITPDTGYQWSDTGTTEARTETGNVTIPTGGGQIVVNASSQTAVPTPSPTFGLSDLGIICGVNLPGAGVPFGSSLLLELMATSHESSVLDITASTAITAFTDPTPGTTRNVTVFFEVSGVIPSGFPDSGLPYTFLGDVTCAQNSLQPTLFTNGIQGATTIPLGFTSALTISKSGGTAMGPITYSWSVSNSNATIVGGSTASTATIEGVSAGNAIVTATITQQGITVTETVPVTVTAVPDEIEISSIFGPAVLEAFERGDYVTTVTNASGPSTITWSWSVGGDGSLAGAPINTQTSSTISIEATGAPGLLASILLDVTATKGSATATRSIFVTVQGDGSMIFT